MKKLIFALALIILGFQVQAEEKVITTSDGVNLYVNVKGKGAPCLYLHGGPGSGSYWFEKFFGEFMESQYTMIYLDQRGVGRSGGDANGNYSMDRFAKDFEEVREALGYESWVTVGHSFGGILQMGYIERYPEAVKGMIMINCTLDLKTSFCESWSPKAAEFSGIVDSTPCDTPENIRFKLGNHISQLRDKDLFWKMGYTNKENEKILDATSNDIQNWNGSFGNKALEIADFWKDYRPSAPSIEIPVLFFYGTKDWMVGPEHYKNVNFPQQLLWKTEGAHMPFMENRNDLEEAILTYKNQFHI